MNAITQVADWPERESRPATFILPLYLWVVFGAVIGVGVIALLEYNAPASNPFSAYADIFPGQPESVISTREFSCARSDIPLNPGSLEKECRLNPATGTFTRIDVMISKGVIYQTTFSLPENTMRVGDLLLLLGSSSYRPFPPMVTFSWEGKLGIASIIPNDGDYSAFHYVWRVALTDMILPD